MQSCVAAAQTTSVGAGMGSPQPSLGAAPPDYLKEVKPLLAKNCFQCHGLKAQKGGLRVDTAKALLAGGAEPRGRNNSGSAPLHLAVQNTGRGGSGTPHAIEQQKQIIELLLRAGARPDDKDANGKAVRDAVTAEWIRALF